MEKYGSNGVHFVFQCIMSEKYIAKYAVIVVTTRAYCGADRPVYLMSSLPYISTQYECQTVLESEALQDLVQNLEEYFTR